MGTNYVLWIGLFLVLVAVDCSGHDLILKVNQSANTSLDQNVGDNTSSIKNQGGSNLDSNSVEAKKANENKGGKVNVLQDAIEGSVSQVNSTDQSGSKEGSDVQISDREPSPETKGKSGDIKNERSSGNVDTKKLLNEGDHAGEAMVRKDGFRAEECDRSTMCTDKDKKFVACFQVPGNESPDIFLLIINKAKGPRTITISAPAFVQLEKTNVHVPEKEDQKVKVSVRDGGTGNMIVLKEGSSNCSLDFKDLITLNSVKDSDESAKSYVSFISQSPTTAIVFFAALLMLASGWMCFSIRKGHLLNSHSKYQRLDMELPVSAGAKTEYDVNDVNDGWDNSWGDSWDDEEAPHTPSMPVTPSLSSKGLASRRLNKEGWKD